LLYLSATAAFAQYRFDSWTTDDGLPHISIWALRQTRDGYLWLATGDGLARFDGVRFRVFHKANTPGLTNANFTPYAMLEDRQGALWAGTAYGGVVRYRDGVFTTYTTKDGLADNRVVRVDEDAEGTVWVYTRTGLAQWKDGRLKRVAPAPGSPFNDHLVAPKNLSVDAIFFGLWRQTAGGWERFAYGRWSSFPLPPHLPDMADPAKLNISAIVEDSERRLWYGVMDRPQEAYCVSDGRLTVYQGLPSNSFVCYQDRSGHLWLSDRDGDTSLWKDGQLTPLVGFSTASVFRAWEDREGGLWIGTKNEGLYRLRGQPINVLRRPGGPWLNTINALWQDRSGDVWLGSNGGLSRFRDGRFDNYPRPGATLGEQPNVFSALFEERDGVIRVGTFDGVTHFRDGRLFEDKDLSAQITRRITAIHRDRAGDLWFGSNQGLYRLGDNRRDGKLERYTTADGLAGDNVTALCEDHAGALWIGTQSGLSRFAGGHFASLTEADGLSSNRVSAIYEDGAEVLWVGTFDGGLNRLTKSAASPNGQNEMKITRYTTEQGMFSNAIFHILEDDQGWMWFSCHLGLHRVRKQELNDFADGRISRITSIRFGKADGFITEECRAVGQPAGLKTRDGRLWFPTQDGVAVIDPKAVPANPHPPPVVIESFLLDRQPVAFDRTVRIAPGQENFEVEYTALSFINSGQIRFKYKLAGLDHDWVDVGVRRTAYFSHVPPGEYTFTVTAANSDGVWNTEGASLRVVVLAPFYRTWWFMALASLGVIGIALAGYRRRVAALRAKHAAREAFSRQLIESQELERKRIAAELHDGLGQNLLVIKNRALLGLLAPGNQERAVEQLNEISTAVSQTLDEVRQIAANLHPYQLDRLGLAKAIEAMIRKVAAAAGIKFSTEIDNIDGLLDPQAEINLYRIVQESLNNIVKHSAATEAAVAIKRDVQRVAITIRDNGKGFVVEPARNTGPLKRGFGLAGMSERARMLGGDYAIHSTPGGGTTITLTIDLKTEPKIKPEDRTEKCETEK
jgi:signal transduction histidine kinase/ligand-binding sensor domain-containing protein